MLSQEELEKIREEIRSAIEELNLARETRKEMEGYLKAIEEQLKAYKEKIEAGGETYTVRKGDSLWKISKKYYGTPFKWPLIYRANKDKIKDPNRIFPGQVLRIPPPSEEEIRPPLMHLK
ncbi:MAG TPA: LysM peptidoglycan-binding domain-containing protein [bacterium]|nr:LysM peptidoglycan-binding domain-containing protein [bacterium]HEX68439.1 LysM peptidoglycan-binding domain-containing protein [bacterium]